MIVPLVGARCLDEVEYVPLLRELDDRRARLLLHPISSTGSPIGNERHLDAVLALARLTYRDRLRKLLGLRLMVSHTAGLTEFLAENLGMLHYLQEGRWHMGTFLLDHCVRRRLVGVERVRQVEVCAEMP